VARRLAVAVATGPGLAYRQDASGGSVARLADIGTVAIRDVRYTADGAYLAVAHVSSQYAMYRRDTDAHIALARPASISTGGAGVAWHGDGQRLAYTFGSANRLYAFLRTGDAYAYAGANVGGNPTSTAQSRAVDYGGDYVAVGMASTPFIYWYAVDATGILTKQANPAVLGRSAATTLAWSPDGTILAIGQSLTPRLILYRRDGGTLTRLADPPQPPVTASHTPAGMAWSPDGTRLVFATEGGLRYFIHDGAGGLTLGPDPDVQPPGTVFNGVAFDREGGQLAATSNAAPFLTLYTHTGDALLAQPALTTGAPTDVATAVAWTPDDGVVPPAPEEVALGPVAITASATTIATLRSAQALGASLTAGAGVTATLRTASPLAAAVEAGAGSTATLRSAAALRAALHATAVQDATLRARIRLAAELRLAATPMATLRVAVRLRAALVAGASVTGVLRSPSSRELLAVVGDARVDRRTGQARVTERVTGTAGVTNRTGAAHL